MKKKKIDKAFLVVYGVAILYALLMALTIGGVLSNIALEVGGAALIVAMNTFIICTICLRQKKSPCKMNTNTKISISMLVFVTIFHVGKIFVYDLRVKLILTFIFLIIIVIYIIFSLIEMEKVNKQLKELESFVDTTEEEKEL